MTSKMTEHDSLKIVSININGIQNKINTLIHLIETSKPDLLLIQETKLSKNNNLQFSHPNYNINEFRRENLQINNNSPGGGLMTLTKKDFQIIDEYEKTKNNNEFLSTKIKTKNNNFEIINYYNPNTNLIDCNTINSLTKNKNSILIGDLNAKHQNWYNIQTNTGGIALNNAIQNNDLAHSEHSEYTYKHPATGLESTIDIAIWDPNKLVSTVTTENLDDVGSDHTPVTFKIKLKDGIEKLTINNKIKQYNKVNWANTNNLLIQKFQNPPTNANEIDENIQKLEKYIKTITKAVPETTVNRTNHGISKDIRNDISKKRKLQKEYKRTRNPVTKTEINRLNKKIQKNIKANESRFTNKKIDQANSNDSKESWKGIKSLLGKKQKENIKKIYNPVTKKDTTLKSEIAEIFKNSQEEIFRGNDTIDQNHENNVNDWYNHENFEHNYLPTNHFETENISNIIKNLKNNKAPGLDNIQNVIIKYLEPSLSKILQKIFNSCYEIGYFPKRWKEGKVIMLYKNKGQKNDSKNYRPITLLNQFGKIFEKTIEQKIRSWAEENNKINLEQSGFRKKRSTNDQLFLLTQQIFEAFNRKSGIDAIFIDFEKCFDKIWKKGLLYKLKKLQISQKNLNIINSFLHDRSIFILVENEKSNTFSPNEGLPQGSCLSPLLFALYASDIPTDLKVFLSQFADDLAIYARQSNRNYEKNKNLQKLLDLIVKWCEKWKLKINIGKTNQITFTKSSSELVRNYTINNKKIKEVKEIYFLGITLDKQLTFNSHIETICNNTNGCRQSIHKLNNLPKNIAQKTKRKIYLTTGRSILEYGSPALLNISQQNKNKIEVSQNNCLRAILRADYMTSTRELRNRLKVTTVYDRKLTLAKNWFNQAHTNPKNIVSHTQFKYYPVFDKHKTPHHIITSNQ